MLEASGKTEKEKLQIFNDAIASVNAYNELEPRKFYVNTLENYLKYRYTNRESYSVLDFEMEHLRNGKAFYKPFFSFTNPELAIEVEQYHEKQVLYTKQKLNELLQVNLNKNENARAGITSLAERHYGDIVEAFSRFELDSHYAKTHTRLYTNMLANLEDQKKIELVNAFEASFAKMEAELRGIGERVSQDSSKFKTEVGEVKGMGRFVQLLLGGVFKNISKKSAKDMISGGLDYPDQRTDQERFKLVLAYGEPNLLKLLQLVARMEGIDPKMREAFQALESGGKAAPLAVVEEFLAREAEAMANKGIRILEIERAFHAGTIAQMHKVKMEITKEDGSKEVKKAALRIIKPGMMDKILRGVENMLASATVIDADPQLREAGFPKFKPSIEAQGNNILKDVDTKGSSIRQLQGKKSYSHTLELSIEEGHRFKFAGIKSFPKTVKKLHINYMVPEVYYYSDPEKQGNRLMLMEIVKGEKLEDLRTSEPAISKEIARGLMHKWVSEAFIRSGFIHADLHFGNFMAEMSHVLEETKFFYRLRGIEKEEVHINVPIIDFGMGGVIDKDFRRSFVSLVVAGKLNHPEAMKEILWKLSIEEKTEISKLEFYKAFDEKYQANKNIVDEEKRMKSKDWVVWSINKGLVLPEQFVSLSRGTGIMLLLAVRYELAKKLTDMMKSSISSDKSLVVDAIRGGIVDWSVIKNAAGAKISTGLGKLKTSCNFIFK